VNQGVKKEEKPEIKQEEPAELVACTLDELIAQSSKAATPTKRKQTSPLPESTPKAPKAMFGLFQGTPTKGLDIAHCIQQPTGTISFSKASSKPCASSESASSSRTSEVRWSIVAREETQFSKEKLTREHHDRTKPLARRPMAVTRQSSPK